MFSLNLIVIANYVPSEEQGVSKKCQIIALMKKQVYIFPLTNFQLLKLSCATKRIKGPTETHLTRLIKDIPNLPIFSSNCNDVHCPLSLTTFLLYQFHTLLILLYY